MSTSLLLRRRRVSARRCAPKVSRCSSTALLDSTRENTRFRRHQHIMPVRRFSAMPSALDTTFSTTSYASVHASTSANDETKFVHTESSDDASLGPSRERVEKNLCGLEWIIVHELAELPQSLFGNARARNDDANVTAPMAY
jgi:hypothetical protein